jgi:hypothetical protein
MELAKSELNWPSRSDFLESNPMVIAAVQKLPALIPSPSVQISPDPIAAISPLLTRAVCVIPTPNRKDAFDWSGIGC